MIKLLGNRKSTAYYISEIAKDVQQYGLRHEAEDGYDWYHPITCPFGKVDLLNNPTVVGLGVLQHRRVCQALRGHFDPFRLGLEEVSDALPTDLLLASLEVLERSLRE